MPASFQTLVADRPERPLVVYDDDCGFCRQWVRRWEGMSGDRVEYRPFPEVAGRFPEIGEDAFRARVWLIEPDGTARGGAGAVVRLYVLVGERRWLGTLYEVAPGVAEGVYHSVARHRRAASAIVWLLWGTIDRRPSYRWTRSIFLRGLGVAYLAAFASLAVQMDGLIGSRGIAPAADFLERAEAVLEGRDLARLPTVLWFDASDRMLHVLCWGGVLASLMLIAGVVPLACLVFLWASYLSLENAGSPFLSYQWDALLLESGVLGILLAPWTLLLDRARRPPSTVALWLVRWLVFRLMFLSGVVKLTSHDPAWAAWEAMKYHYETQPLPTWTSWYMHQMPAWFHRWSVGFMFWAELIAPFFVFGPRRVRMLGFWSIVLLQLLIMATGNFGFFNALSIVLCLVLVEDRDWGRKRAEPAGAGRRPVWMRLPLYGVAVVIVIVTTMQGLNGSGLDAHPFREPLEALRRKVVPFHSTNTYSLFAVMTTQRPEILLEGSRDGVTWTPYTFRWKPGDPDRRPRFCTPHLPRLDWQMWFAALGGDCRSEPWFLAFERRILEGSPEVLALLAENPFPDRPPRYLRARLYLYRFTHRGERAWWSREEVGPFCPAVELPERSR